MLVTQLEGVCTEPLRAVGAGPPASGQDACALIAAGKLLLPFANWQPEGGKDTAGLTNMADVRTH